MNILITGTSKGIGERLAKHFLMEGHTVYGISRTPSKNILENSQMWPQTYKHVFIDITQESEVQAYFSEIDQLHCLINNAGISTMNHSLLTPIDTARKIMDVNFIGTFLMCREAARKMVNGKIINLSTIAVPLSIEGESIYASSKAAVEQLTKILAKEFAVMGTTVNAVGPSLVKTDLLKHVPRKKLQAILDKQSIKRYAEFRDVVNVIEFFIRPASDFITGQVVYLGGL